MLRNITFSAFECRCKTVTPPSTLESHSHHLLGREKRDKKRLHRSGTPGVWIIPKAPSAAGGRVVTESGRPAETWESGAEPGRNGRRRRRRRKEGRRSRLAPKAQGTHML